MNAYLLNLTYYDFYQGLLTLSILIVGLIICLLFSKSKSDIKYIILLYIWHTLYSVIYYYISLNSSSDAKNYYIWSLTRDSFSPLPGTSFITYITASITSFINSNYFNTTLVSNIFGAIGLIFLYLSIKKFLVKLNILWLLVIFMPSISFWSAGLGKDSFSFMATCIFLYGVISYKRIAIIVAFIVMFMVRPHIAFIMSVSFVFFFIFKSKAHILLKLLTLPIILTGAIFTLKFVQQYVGLDNTSLESLEQYVDKRQDYNQEGGSSLDISSLSYPMQMFTYIFRPLPFEAHSAVALITSMENTALLLLSLYITFKSKFNFRAFIKDENMWLLIYAFLTCTILSLTTANLGIATRQKWMFMPVLIYLLIYAFHDHKTKTNKVYS